MNILYFDLEADGLLDTVTKAHCMVIIENNVVTKYRPSEVHEGALRLLQATKDGSFICGHNIINYDIPVLEKLFADFRLPRECRGKVIDTLVLARLVYSDVSAIDMILFKRNIIPGKLIGSHSLKAWGYRLGELKGTYGEQEGAWDKFTEEMLSYNVQDVVVTQKLYLHLVNKKDAPTSRAVQLEHKIAWLMAQQERNGFTFNVVGATHLEFVLRARMAELQAQLVHLAPPIPDKVIIPKRDNKALGYKAGTPVQKYKEFNPNSRQQIEWLITKHFGYTPADEKLFDTVTKRLKVDEETLNYIKNDMTTTKEVRHLASVLQEALMLGKRLGQLADGKYAWLKLVKEDGRIHGRVNTCGTVTGRASHSYPNVAQVPNVASPYGHECRELFKAPDGWTQAGIDASGLELRCLAHYMSKYDGGAYAHEILNGDIHTANQHAAGLATRNEAKTFIYAFLYGGGDELIGKLLGGDASVGKKVKKRFLEGTPALKSLRQSIHNALVLAEKYGKVTRWKRKFLRGLDGRVLPVRSIHSALNLLLQSCGAVLCKYWAVRLEERLLDLGLDHGKDFQFMAWVHDEVQIACRTKGIAEVAVREAQKAMRDTQKYYNFRVQLDTEGKIGKNWSDCH